MTEMTDTASMASDGTAAVAPAVVLDTHEKVDAAHQAAVFRVAKETGDAALQRGATTEEAIAEIVAACQPIDAWRDSQYLRLEGRLN